MRTFASMLKNIVSNHSHDNTVCKIITLKNRESFEKCIAELKKHNITPYTKVDSINMLCFHIHGDGEETLQMLQKNPHVHRIETDIEKHMPLPIRERSFPDKELITALPNQIPWWLARIGAPNAWKVTQGDGVKVAIVDTGISPHPDLVIVGGVNIINPNISSYDDNGHGTGVAGIVAATGNNNMQFGVAPKAALYAVKVLDSTGSGLTSTIIAGLDWCIQNGMNVVNMSFGAANATEAEQLMVEQVYRAGIVMVAGTGNFGPDDTAILFPAQFSEVIAVAATDEQNDIAYFSSRGAGIAVAAPGVNIVTTNNIGGFSSVSGTSFASPNVSGVAALMLANQSVLSCPILAKYPVLYPFLVKNILEKTVLSLLGFTSFEQGAGLIQANVAVSEFKC